MIPKAFLTKIVFSFRVMQCLFIDIIIGCVWYAGLPVGLGFDTPNHCLDRWERGLNFKPAVYGRQPWAVYRDLLQLAGSRFGTPGLHFTSFIIDERALQFCRQQIRFSSLSHIYKTPHRPFVLPTLETLAANHLAPLTIDNLLLKKPSGARLKPILLPTLHQLKDVFVSVMAEETMQLASKASYSSWVINMRKLAPPKQDDKHSPHGNLSGKSSSSPDSLGFGRTLSEKSLDMAIRHMDIRRSIPGSLRPLMTNIPASSMYSVRILFLFGSVLMGVFWGGIVWVVGLCPEGEELSPSLW